MCVFYPRACLRLGFFSQATNGSRIKSHRFESCPDCCVVYFKVNTPGISMLGSFFYQNLHFLQVLIISHKRVIKPQNVPHMTSYILVPIDLISSTPNDMDLGEKIRTLYYQTKTGDRDAEQVHHEQSFNNTGLQPVPTA